MHRFVWVLGLAVGLLAACSGPPLGLRVSPEEATVEPGGELRFTFTGASASDLVWTARYGTLVADGDGALYRAPDYAVDDVVEAVLSSDPRERVRVLVRVRGTGAMTPRIRVASDLALIFTEAGQERTLNVVVYDAQGRPDPDAAVHFASDDPERVTVEATGPRSARVRALTGEIGTVRLTIRTADAAAYAWAVVAEPRPGAVQLEPSWILDGRWDPSALSWNEITLVRLPATESLEPGQVVFSGDRSAVWGRVAAVRSEGERVVLVLDPAGLTDVFENLDYAVELPSYAVSLSTASADRLRLSGPGGVERLAAAAACPGLQAGPLPSGALQVSVHGAVTIANGRLERARWNVTLSGKLQHGALDYGTASAEATCSWLRWEAELPPLSGLLFPVQMRLAGALELTREEGAAPARLTLPPWRSGVQAGRDDEATSGEALKQRSTQQLEPEPVGEAEPRLRFEAPGEVSLILNERVELHGRTQALGRPLFAGRLLGWRQSLALHAVVEGPLDPAEAGYRGPDWRLDWSGAPAEEDANPLFAALPGLAPAPEARPKGAEVRTIARAPQVWGHLDTGGVRRIDLGAAEGDPAARFNFETEPPREGEVEVWLRGGACEEPGACFDNPLERVAAVSFPGGPLFWRPAKGDRGIYEVFLRYRVGTAGQDHPYAARPPDPLIVVEGPDLQELPLAVTLRGAPGGTAVGVLRYRNASLDGVHPDGTPVQLTSTLQVWTPAEARLLATPRQLALPAGRWGYQRLSAACPKTPGAYTAELPLYTNDPGLAEVTLPVNLICDDRPPPEPSLEASPGTGAAPLETTFRLGLPADAAAKLACQLDFGDGTPARTWPAGTCPAQASLKHVYTRPGRYQATLLVIAEDEPLDLAFVFVEVD